MGVKWNELNTQKKVMIGIGSAVAVAAVGTGATMAMNSDDDQPAQTKVADNKENKTQTSENKMDKDSKATAKGTDTKGVKSDIKKTVAKNEENKNEENKKETITEKDGKTVKVTQSGIKTPSATVKVEKKQLSSTKDGSKKVVTANPTPNKVVTPKKTESTKPAPEKSTSTRTTKNTSVTESIAYKTVYQNDSTLNKGKQIVVKNGQTGSKKITYKDTYVNGNRTSRVVVSSQITKNPVNRIVKVGTKVASTYVSASKAHSILSGSGMSRSGSNGYELSLAENVDVSVRVGGNHVSSIYFNGEKYIPWKSASQQELIDILGEKEGKEAYRYGQAQASKIERAVRAAANATYGSGTAKANSLYSQIINSKSFSKSF